MLTNRGKALRRLLLLFLFVALILTQAQTPPQTSPQTPAQAPAKPPAKKAPRPKPAAHPDNALLQGAKFQIGDLVVLLRSVRSGRLKQSRLIEAIQSRGIAFPPSELNLARLMNSGAAEPVLEAIEKLSAAQPPPPAVVEPIKPTYTLVVTCQPAECETRVGDQEFRETVDGKASFIQLPAGRVILDAKKPGFEIKTEIVALDPSSLSPSGSFLHTVALTPTSATQGNWGASLLTSVIAKAKVPADQATVSGALTISDPAATDWKLTAHLSGSGAQSLDLESGMGRASYASSAGFWQVKSSRKSPFRGTREQKAKAESALLRNMDMWIAFEYFTIMRRISAPGMAARSRSNPAVSDSPKELEIAVAQGTLLVTLNSDLQPSAISLLSSNGAKGPARVEFSDYRPMAGGIYPSRTSITFLDAETHKLVLVADRFDDEKIPVHNR